ncbi:sodium/proton antiporter, CPA1 family [Friedmanniella luteola]|uniref:Sodium/proton antiporter, CPA1 family n=1 Tax=Friedmanniella luteola TaxID=546871 RepID=A0A1H1YPQ0_9ACTN|nr:Na+/H+ antiporter [Friedmanniella luteola]SDT23443.1 sodium/proton antiporter, CPA1 family [Friedmanniella luteola]
MARVDTAIGICAIVASVLVVTAVADRLRFPAPLLLMLVGIGASFVPFIDEPELTPELVLLGFLPPLLYATAIRSSIIDFRTHRRPIAFLSVLLVVITALGIGLITWLLLPVPFAVAFALGAVVAPPDAVAATSIARRIGLPRRVITLLEGESLLNDATAITCLRVALVAIAGAVSAWEIGLGFVIAVAGALIGVGVAALAVVIRRHVHNPVFDTAISLLVPFVAYLPAEALHYRDFHGSGVIAVVTAGLVLGHKSPVIQSGQSRLAERVNWATIQFLLENTVFLLIGLQARRIVEALSTSTLSGGQIALFVAAVLVGVIVLRLVWVTISRFLIYRVDRETGEGRPPWSHTIVVGWAGLRGVVTLAAAFLIPEDVEHRAVLIFAAMVVTAGTLLIQGLTLPALVRVLKMRGPDARSDALQAATVLTTAGNAGLAALDRLAGPEDEASAVQLVRDRISSRSDALWEKLGTGRDAGETPAEQYRRLRLGAMRAERDEVLRVRSSGTVDHDVVEQVLASFDIEESMLTIATERVDRLSENQSVATPLDPSGSCVHLDTAPADVEPRSEVCLDCVREGTRSVHLRRCLACGNVGCCDSSVGRHAERHFHTSHHPVMRSHEDGESWRWCYLDERLG